MVDSIEMLISRGGFDIYKILIVPKLNVCYMNNKKLNIDNDKINHILRLLASWKYEYGISNVLDAEEFTITVCSNKKTTYHGKGVFPDSYDELLRIIGDVEHDR